MRQRHAVRCFVAPHIPSCTFFARKHFQARCRRQAFHQFVESFRLFAVRCARPIEHGAFCGLCVSAPLAERIADTVAFSGDNNVFRVAPKPACAKTRLAPCQQDDRLRTPRTRDIKTPIYVLRQAPDINVRLRRQGGLHALYLIQRRHRVVPLWRSFRRTAVRYGHGRLPRRIGHHAAIAFTSHSAPPTIPLRRAGSREATPPLPS